MSEDPIEKAPETLTEKQKAKPISSLIGLLVIGLVLFYASKAVLDGEIDISNLAGKKTESKEQGIAPKKLDREMRKISQEFLTQLEAQYTPEEFEELKKTFKIHHLAFSSDKKELVIEATYFNNAKKMSERIDILFVKDKFDRYASQSKILRQQIKIHSEK